MAVAHVVLFDLRSDLSAEDARRFSDAFRHALEAIPTIRRVRVGRRTPIGAEYETAASGAYSYIAVIEFDDAAGLRAYLEHAAHAELGARFWSSAARSLVLDFELAGGDVPHAFGPWS